MPEFFQFVDLDLLLVKLHYKLHFFLLQFYDLATVPFIDQFQLFYQGILRFSDPLDILSLGALAE